MEIFEVRNRKYKKICATSIKECNIFNNCRK